MTPFCPSTPEGCSVKVLRPMRRPLLIAALLCAASCKRSEDEAARARIFSPEQPVGELPEAKEQLQGGQLADDPALMRRVLHMQRREIDQRIGPHKAQQRVQFAWFRGPGLPDGGSEVSLAEETALLEAPGDDFSLVALPLSFDGARPAIRRAPPSVGQHDTDVQRAQGRWPR